MGGDPVAPCVGQEDPEYEILQDEYWEFLQIFNLSAPARATGTLYLFSPNTQLAADLGEYEGDDQTFTEVVSIIYPTLVDG